MHAMWEIAKADKKDSKKYEAMLEKIVPIEPNWYYHLGDIYAEDGQPDKALDCYKKFVSLCNDGVLVSNKCGWLVDYYFDHGQKDKAVKLADRAAEVYSARGLDTKAQR